MVLKRVGIGSAAKLAGAIYASLGLIIGAVVALVSVAGAGLTAASQSEVPAWIGAVFGITAIVWMPLVYGVMGLVVGALSAALYNLFSRIVGGLRLDLQPSFEAPQPLSSAASR
jgi:uncharacterized membrane protein YkvI